MINHRTQEGSAVVQSLADLLAERTHGQGGWIAHGRDVERLCLKLCGAVEALHASGAVHGALRPSVFQLDAEGTVALLPATSSPARAAVLGYASPEVASGSTPTPASDAFSLALVLFEVLAGAPSRAGSEQELTAQAKGGRVPIPKGLPERFTSLAVRSTAAEADRRPTPAQWRAAFEHPAPPKGARGTTLLLGTCVVALAAVFGATQQRTAAAYDRSASRLAEAQVTSDELLIGTFDELGRMDNVGPLAAVGARILASIEAAERAGELDDRERLAMALVWNGRAQRILGEAPLAAELFIRAIEVASELRGSPFATEGEIAARVALGELAVEDRDFKTARAHFVRVIELCEGSIESGAADRSLRLAHLRALISFGDVVMSTGRSSAANALRLFRRARAALEDLDGAAGSGSTEVITLRCDLRKLEANMAFQSGERGHAVELLKEHVELAQELIECDPGSMRARQNLARGADVLARTQRELGEVLGATEAHRISVAAWSFLREMEPANVTWQREWAKSTSLLAHSLRVLGKGEESVLLHRESIELLEAMMAADDLPSSFSVEVKRQQLSCAEGYLAAGALRKARDELPGLKPPLKGRRGGDLKIRIGVVEAELLLAEGRWLRARTKALSVMDAIQAAAMDGRDRGLRLDRARALLVSGSVAEIDGDPELADSSRGRALGLLSDLQAERPLDPELISLRARTLFILGRREEADQALKSLDALGVKDARLAVMSAAARQLDR